MNRSAELLLGSLTHNGFAPSGSSALRPRFRGSKREKIFWRILTPTLSPGERDGVRASVPLTR